MHTSSDFGRASLSDVAPADHASIRGSGARSAGRRRGPSGGGARGGCAPGERSFHHPAHAAESRAVVGAAAGDHRFHASATARDCSCRGHSRDRQSQSENGDLVAERRGQPTCGAAPPATRIAMATYEKADDPRHLPYRPANGRKVRENADAVHMARGQVIPCKLASSRRNGRTTENRGVPGSSPPLAIKTLLQIRGFCRALRGARKGRKRQMALPGIGD
jgi:hypothetical protein